MDNANVKRDSKNKKKKQDINSGIKDSRELTKGKADISDSQNTDKDKEEHVVDGCEKIVITESNEKKQEDIGNKITQANEETTGDENKFGDEENRFETSKTMVLDKN